MPITREEFEKYGRAHWDLMSPEGICRGRRLKSPPSGAVVDIAYPTIDWAYILHVQQGNCVNPVQYTNPQASGAVGVEGTVPGFRYGKWFGGIDKSPLFLTIERVKPTRAARVNA